jgi:preprotein translocase subunit SecB
MLALANDSDATEEAVALEADTNATTNVTVVVTIVTVTTFMVARAVMGSTIYKLQIGIGQFNFANRVRREAAKLLFTQAPTILFVFPCAYDVKAHLLLLSLLP